MGVSYPEVPVLKRIRDEPHLAIHGAETDASAAAAAAAAAASPPCRTRATPSSSSSYSSSSCPPCSHDDGGFGGEKVVSEPLVAQLRLEPLRRLEGTSNSTHNDAVNSFDEASSTLTHPSVSFHPWPPAN